MEHYLFIFPYIGNNHPNWLIFFRGVETTNQINMQFSIAILVYWRRLLKRTCQQHPTASICCTLCSFCEHLKLTRSLVLSCSDATPVKKGVGCWGLELQQRPTSDGHRWRRTHHLLHFRKMITFVAIQNIIYTLIIYFIY